MFMKESSIFCRVRCDRSLESGEREFILGIGLPQGSWIVACRIANRFQRLGGCGMREPFNEALGFKKKSEWFWSGCVLVFFLFVHVEAEAGHWSEG